MKDGKNLHVPLPGSLHDSLREAAKRAGKPATVLAREAIEAYLRQLNKAAIDGMISDWAREMGGSELDLDPALEEAGLEFLSEDEPGA
jgi:hypothetical protein